MRRFRGLKALVHDAVDATTELVREGHDSTARTVLRVTDAIEPLAGPARTVDAIRRLGTAGTLASVRAVNRVVEALTDVALDVAGVDDRGPAEPPVPMRSDAMGTAAWVADASLGALNGAVGDQLAARGNSLDLGLVLRHGDRYLDLDRLEVPGAGPRLVVLIHGLAATEWSWCLDAEAFLGDPASHFGAMLQRDLGLVPVYVRYNTGRTVQTNGRALADALERLVARWPVPVEEVVLLGHSMGGLVARSACFEAQKTGQGWLGRVRRVVSLGTPHQGAPLARFGSAAAASLGAVDLPATRIVSRLIDGRSAGVKDLDEGHLLGDGPDPDATAPPERRVVPLLDGVAYVFLSATLTTDAAHPVGAWLGDLLVQVPSASGPAVSEERVAVERATFGGTAHYQIQVHPEVYAQVLRVCRTATESR